MLSRVSKAFVFRESYKYIHKLSTCSLRMPSSEDCDRIQELEHEQEKLTGSLLALTSHFAQVQFRLKQIIE